MRIESYSPHHLESVVRVSLRSWAPVFVSIEKALDPEVYREFHPDWRAHQKKTVEDACADESTKVWVAIEGDAIAGFVAVKLHAESKMGEIYMIAVDPDFQRRDIGAELTACALDWMKGAGMTVAMVETGGDPGHGPARRLYERSGFRLFPVARYFKKL